MRGIFEDGGVSSQMGEGVLRSSEFEEGRTLPPPCSIFGARRYKNHPSSTFSAGRTKQSPSSSYFDASLPNSGQIFWNSESRSSDRSSSFKIGLEIEIGPLLRICYALLSVFWNPNICFPCRVFTFMMYMFESLPLQRFMFEISKF